MYSRMHHESFESQWCEKHYERLRVTANIRLKAKNRRQIWGLYHASWYNDMFVQERSL